MAGNQNQLDPQYSTDIQFVTAPQAAISAEVSEGNSAEMVEMQPIEMAPVRGPEKRKHM
jgi:hypothetical protein